MCCVNMLKMFYKILDLIYLYAVIEKLLIFLLALEITFCKRIIFVEGKI